jgi:hypothetical protein
MANPVGFTGARGIADAAPGDEAQVRSLPMFMDERQIISCWRLTPEELEHVVLTGVVWLSVSNIGVLPPVYVSGTALVEVNGEPSIAEPYFPPPTKGSS